ncbi:MAG TPA: hypothetical protein PLJ37_09365 [Chitinophagales bacterium]|nr:hypothetical protein [Chitinophagales bacterium]HMU98837.1 hypothetical protein [Chitinophagales bacterium]HMV03434.1 hypothetical protein [Chitinophagales bacterium]HMW95223.1 hypothetical protein [Chitinophagales bacterium]HMY43311.1 hypothetical protein [Chitinophagales bacterium]
MKEDILEQLVDGYFLRKPATFTKHNVKFKPKKENISHLEKKEKSKFSVSSDIDVLAVHLNEKSEKRVSVISCKSWQDGFNIDFFYDHLIDKEKRNVRVGTSDAWKKFRELVEPNWAKAFREKIAEETNSFDFTYYIAITKIKKNKGLKIEEFKKCKLFLDNLSDNGKHNVKIEFLTLEDMLTEIFNEKADTIIEATEIGRFMQLIKAAGLKIER